MVRCPHHTFQVLTKRSERMVKWTVKRFTPKTFPKNVWLGVSAENQDYTFRIEHLRNTPARTRFVSFEPLLGPIELKQDQWSGVHWAIVGGESGRRARRMQADWARSLRDQCHRAGVAYFFKQWGAFDPTSGKRVGKKKAGRILDGRTWEEYPDTVLVQLSV